MPQLFPNSINTPGNHSPKSRRTGQPTSSKSRRTGQPTSPKSRRTGQLLQRQNPRRSNPPKIRQRNLPKIKAHLPILQQNQGAAGNPPPQNQGAPGNQPPQIGAILPKTKAQRAIPLKIKAHGQPTSSKPGRNWQYSSSKPGRNRQYSSSKPRRTGQSSSPKSRRTGWQSSSSKSGRTTYEFCFTSPKPNSTPSAS